MKLSFRVQALYLFLLDCLSSAFLLTPHPPAGSIIRIPRLDSTSIVVKDPETWNAQATKQVTELVAERSQSRAQGDYETADALYDTISSLAVNASNHGLSIRITDQPHCYSSSNSSDGSLWSLVYTVPTETTDTDQPSILNIAHSALGSQVVAADAAAQSSHTRQTMLDTESTLKELVQQAKIALQPWSRVHRQLHLLEQQDTSSSSSVPSLSMTWESLQELLIDKDWPEWARIEGQLQGRKAADAAFWFALAGCTDEELFELLAHVSTKELDRFGRRPSCRLKDVWQMVERLAAAGIRDNDPLQEVVQECLVAKNVTLDESSALLNLHSDHCSLMLWEFSTRQRKQRSFLQKAAQHFESSQDPGTLATTDTAFNDIPPERDVLQDAYNWKDLFHDTNRPLIIDVGCGMGVSLLGLASGEHFADCNLLGVDLNSITIGYARGIADRWWKQEKRLAFVVGAAEEVLQQVLSTYPGPIHRIMIQFPTPYRLIVKGAKVASGNSQLPESPTDGFMVTPRLLAIARDLLTPTLGELLIQSNCEDVAVWMQQMACEKSGFKCQIASGPDDFVMEPAGEQELTQRTLNWISMGGTRAVGPEWRASPLLPRIAMTETEVSCILRATPVHRCLLVPST